MMITLNKWWVCCGLIPLRIRKLEKDQGKMDLIEWAFVAFLLCASIIYTMWIRQTMLGRNGEKLVKGYKLPQT